MPVRTKMFPPPDVLIICASLLKVLSIGSHILSQLEPEAFGPQKNRGQLAAQGFFADQMPRALIMTI